MMLVPLYQLYLCCKCKSRWQLRSHCTAVSGASSINAWHAHMNSTGHDAKWKDMSVCSHSLRP